MVDIVEATSFISVEYDELNLYFC